MKNSYHWILTICTALILVFITGCSLFDGDSTFGANVSSLNRPWELSELYDADGNEISLFESEVHTVTFRTDNSLTGSTSCNTHGGNFLAFRNGEIEINELVATEIACQEPNRSVEFLNGLGNANSFSVEDGRLELHYGDSGLLVFLERFEVN